MIYVLGFVALSRFCLPALLGQVVMFSTSTQQFLIQDYLHFTL